MNVNKISFVGAGNMGASMIKGILRAKLYDKNMISASNADSDVLKILKDETGVNTTLNNKEAVENADIIFVSVKPEKVEEVLKEVEPSIKKDALVVSIAAGVTKKVLKNTIPMRDVVRIMPNLNIAVGEGMCMICEDKDISSDKIEKLKQILDCFGESIILPEEKMNAFIAVSGSSPAYVFMFIEALADSAVNLGIDRATAYNIAAQSVLGSAKMVKQSDVTPAKLKDRVSSPGGTTIEAVRKLEEKGFRSAVIEASIACKEKADEMEENK